MSLSYKQQIVLKRMIREWKTAQQLNTRTRTLDTLVRRGLVECRGQTEDTHFGTKYSTKFTEYRRATE